MSEPNYRPFLREGDLVTAEDVLKWLRSPVGSRVGAHRAWLLKTDALEWAYLDHYEDHIMLAARLDRERRRALRRGALYEWREFYDSASWCRTRGRSLTDDDEAYMLNALTKALAYRAAARVK